MVQFTTDESERYQPGIDENQPSITEEYKKNGNIEKDNDQNSKFLETLSSVFNQNNNKELASQIQAAIYLLVYPSLFTTIEGITEDHRNEFQQLSSEEDPVTRLRLTVDWINKKISTDKIENINTADKPETFDDDNRTKLLRTFIPVMLRTTNKMGDVSRVSNKCSLDFPKFMIPLGLEERVNTAFDKEIKISADVESSFYTICLDISEIVLNDFKKLFPKEKSFDAYISQLQGSRSNRVIANLLGAQVSGIYQNLGSKKEFLHSVAGKSVAIISQRIADFFSKIPEELCEQENFYEALNNYIKEHREKINYSAFGIKEHENSFSSFLINACEADTETADKEETFLHFIELTDRMPRKDHQEVIDKFLPIHLSMFQNYAKDGRNAELSTICEKLNTFQLTTPTTCLLDKLYFNKERIENYLSTVIDEITQNSYGEPTVKSELQNILSSKLSLFYKLKIIGDIALGKHEQANPLVDLGRVKSWQAQKIYKQLSCLADVTTANITEKFTELLCLRGDIASDIQNIEHEITWYNLILTSQLNRYTRQDSRLTTIVGSTSLQEINTRIQHARKLLKQHSAEIHENVAASKTNDNSKFIEQVKKWLDYSLTTNSPMNFSWINFLPKDKIPENVKGFVKYIKTLYDEIKQKIPESITTEIKQEFILGLTKTLLSYQSGIKPGSEEEVSIIEQVIANLDEDQSSIKELFDCEKPDSTSSNEINFELSLLEESQLENTVEKIIKYGIRHNRHDKISSILSKALESFSGKKSSINNIVTFLTEKYTYSSKETKEAILPVIKLAAKKQSIPAVEFLSADLRTYARDRNSDLLLKLSKELTQNISSSRADLSIEEKYCNTSRIQEYLVTKVKSLPNNVSGKKPMLEIMDSNLSLLVKLKLIGNIAQGKIDDATIGNRFGIRRSLAVQKFYSDLSLFSTIQDETPIISKFTDFLKKSCPHLVAANVQNIQFDIEKHALIRGELSKLMQGKSGLLGYPEADKRQASRLKDPGLLPKFTDELQRISHQKTYLSYPLVQQRWREKVIKRSDDAKFYDSLKTWINYYVSSGEEFDFQWISSFPTKELPRTKEEAVKYIEEILVSNELKEEFNKLNNEQQVSFVIALEKILSYNTNKAINEQLTKEKAQDLIDRLHQEENVVANETTQQSDVVIEGHRHKTLETNDASLDQPRDHASDLTDNSTPTSEERKNKDINLNRQTNTETSEQQNQSQLRPVFDALNKFTTYRGLSLFAQHPDGIKAMLKLENNSAMSDNEKLLEIKKILSERMNKRFGYRSQKTQEAYDILNKFFKDTENHNNHNESTDNAGFLGGLASDLEKLAGAHNSHSQYAVK